jgi:hypothetical protein
LATSFGQTSVAALNPQRAIAMTVLFIVTTTTARF